MTIAFVSAAVRPTGAASSSLVQSVPAGTATGDLLLWGLSQSANNAAAITVPTGWSVWQAQQVVGTAGSNQVALVVWYRFASSEPASYTSSGMASARYASTMTAWRGVDSITPQDVTPLTSSSTTTNPTPRSITPVTAGAVVVAQEAVGTASGVTTTTYSSTNLSDVTSVSSTGGATVNVAQGTGWAAWSSGAFAPNLVPTGSLTRGVEITSALRPATTSTTAEGTGSGLRTRTGSATGAHTSAGATTGATARSGSATGSHTSAGTSTGITSRVGSATGLAPDVAVAAGTATGSTSRTGTAAGTRVTAGSATGSTTRTGSAAGVAPVATPSTGIAAGHTERTGSSTSSRPSAGTTTGSHTWASTAVGVMYAYGSATGLLERTGTATGEKPAEPVDVAVLAVVDRSRTSTITERPRQISVRVRGRDVAITDRS